MRIGREEKQLLPCDNVGCMLVTQGDPGLASNGATWHSALYKQKKLCIKEEHYSENSHKSKEYKPATASKNIGSVPAFSAIASTSRLNH